MADLSEAIKKARIVAEKQYLDRALRFAKTFRNYGFGCRIVTEKYFRGGV